MAQSSTQKQKSDAASSQGVLKDIKFENEVLEEHNKLRAMHGVPPLTVSQDLNKLASEWAAKLIREDKYEHRPNNPYGENIYAKFSTDPNVTLPGQEAVTGWYSEIKDFTFGKEPSGVFKAAHFTQVIWKNSKELGVAKGKSGTGKFVVVANYNPCGNVVGQFTANVPPKRT